MPSLLRAASENGVGLTVIGPEAPLARGIANHFLIMGRHVFGPTKNAAEIESSKVFAKELMQKYNIPCARSASFTSYDEARKYLKQQEMPVVVKADGLAAGKGVTVAKTIEQAQEALADIMKTRIFGSAGDRVLIEEYLTGREMSAFIFADAHYSVPMVSACDYKPVYDGDQGPNTGGMGSYSPPAFDSPELAKTVYETIMEPTARALHDEGRPYRGVLYGGLMITDDGPKVMEFNARFGDPETQAILPRLKTDLLDIMLSIDDNCLDQVEIEWAGEACVGVVMASAGYPGNYLKGLPITGLGDVDKDILVFHAGTSLDPDGKVVTSGGRVLTVVATGSTVAEAREKVYDNIIRIHFEGCHYRRDIALFDDN